MYIFQITPENKKGVKKTTKPKTGQKNKANTW